MRNEDWQSVIPLFTVQDWIHLLPAKDRAVCVEAINAAMPKKGSNSRPGDWLQAVRTAENWYETALLLSNPEFMARVKPFLGDEPPFSLDEAVSEQEFFQMLHEERMGDFISDN